MQGVQSLLTGHEAKSDTHLTQGVTTAVGGALPPAQSVPVSEFESQRVTRGELVAPSSVTERTTNLLESK